MIKNMIGKALITAIAAGALSVAFAGVACADPADPDGVGIGPGGVPEKSGDILRQRGIPVEGIVSPGAGKDGPVYIPGISDIAKLPGPVANSPDLGLPNPGTMVRAITPGCVNGSLGCF